MLDMVLLNRVTQTGYLGDSWANRRFKATNKQVFKTTRQIGHKNVTFLSKIKTFKGLTLVSICTICKSILWFDWFLTEWEEMQMSAGEGDHLQPCQTFNF